MCFTLLLIEFPARTKWISDDRMYRVTITEEASSKIVTILFTRFSTTTTVATELTTVSRSRVNMVCQFGVIS